MPTYKPLSDMPEVKTKIHETRSDKRDLTEREVNSNRIASMIKKQYNDRKIYESAMSDIRSVGEIPPPSDPRLRAQMRYNLKLFLEIVYPNIFYMDWSEDQLTLISELEYRILHGGLKAVAMPRGGGKSSIVFGAIQWCISYGHRKFPFVIKADQDSADKFVDGLRRDWETNQILFGLFPEISLPIKALGGSAMKGKMQTFNGERTHIEWKKDSINFPCLHEYDYDLDHSIGIIIGCRGITGSFRGTNHLHPATGEVIRPDFIVLDDVQTDRVATSPKGIESTIDLIDGAVKGLSPPGELIAGVMPCTVTRNGDVSDTYLSPEVKPEWDGMRCAMVIQWPNGITDDIITDETPESRHWQEYANLRIESLRTLSNISLATDYYRTNFDEMNKNFRVSWEQRYNKDPSYEGNQEISAQQNSMNLRLENIITFSAEYQNKPRKVTLYAAEVPTVAQIENRTIAYPARILPHYVNKLVGFIDVQDEMLMYGVLGLNADFTGVITDYGPFPHFPETMITKQMANKHKLVSREYYRDIKQNPNSHTEENVSTARKKSKQAPFEAKIYWALGQLVDRLFADGRYAIQGNEVRGDTPIGLDYLAIDARWGQAAEVVKRFICDRGDSRLVPYEGIYVGATTRKMHEYRRGDGAVFEDEMHKDLGVCRWVARYDKTTRGRKLLSDVNAWKTFLVLNRLSCPKGSPGAITLFDKNHQEAKRHPLLAMQMVNSENPIPVTARNLTVIEWQESGNHVDNEFLDIFAGCCALGSIAGCRIDDTARSEISKPGRQDLGTRKTNVTSSSSPHETPGGERNVKDSSGATMPVGKTKQAHRSTQIRRAKLSSQAELQRRARQGSTTSLY